jgi:hypothetical protein
MSSALNRRLRAVEVARSGGFETWIEQEDGLVRSLDGKRIMMREEVDAMARAANATLIFLMEGDTLL